MSTSYTPGQAVIDLGTYGKLIHPVQVDGGRWYYYWERSTFGTVVHDELDSIFRFSKDGLLGTDGETNNTFRFATINGVRLALPTVGGKDGQPYGPNGINQYQPGTSVGTTSTSSDSNAINPVYDDLLAIWDAFNGTGTGTNIAGIPSGWPGFVGWSATKTPSGHAYVNLSNGDVYDQKDDWYSGTYAALEVLPLDPAGTPTVQFSKASSTATEGNSGTKTINVQVNLSAVSTLTVTVPISYSGTASSDTDYKNATTSITIPAGQTTASAMFSVLGDSTVEPNETVVLTLGAPDNAKLRNGSIIQTMEVFDIAIQGYGYFEILQQDGLYAYTRHGAFSLDSVGQLVTEDGSLVMPGITIPQGAGLVTISEYGVVSATINETFQQIGQFTLVDFANSNGLKPITENRFLKTVDSGDRIESHPGFDGLGTLKQGFLGHVDGHNIVTHTIVDDDSPLLATRSAWSITNSYDNDAINVHPLVGTIIPSKSWTLRMESNEWSSATVIATGSDGAIYMAGSTDGGRGDAFITKVNPDGAKLWVRFFGSNGDDFSTYATSLAMGMDGAIYMAGWTQREQVGGNSDAFLTKFDQSGSKVWSRTLGSLGFDYVDALTTGSDGAIYMAGFTNPNPDEQVFSGVTAAFLRKFNPDGTKAWETTISSNVGAFANALTTGKDGAIYVAGSSNGNAFITKYNLDGARAWTNHLSLNGYSYGTALTTGKDGEIYMAGSYFASGISGGEPNINTDAFIAKYNPDGTQGWTITINSNKDDYANALTTGSDGAIYMAGTTDGNLDEQINSGMGDAFLTKCNPDGNKIWTIVLGSSYGDSATAIATGKDGEIYLAGETSDGNLYGSGAFLTKWTYNAEKSINRSYALTVLVDKGALGSNPVLLKDLVEEITMTGTTVTSHTLSYQGTKFKYSDIDALITTVIRDGEFTEEFRKEITELAPSLSDISYQEVVSLVGAANVDSILIYVAGADGNYVG